MRIFLLLCGVLSALSATSAEVRFNFGDYAEGASPTNFHSVLYGAGQAPAWKIISADVPSSFGAFAGSAPVVNRARVLAQTSVDMTDERFPMFIYDGDIYRNFKFSAKFKIVSGITEQMAGLVFRFQNTSNFYVARVSVAGRNIRFYKVVNGVRSDPIGPTLAVPAGEWHKLGVACEGNKINILLDDKPVMPTLGDNTFIEGKVGFWTKSDSVSYFSEGEITYTPRIPEAQQAINAVMKNQKRLVGLRIYTLKPDGSTHIIASKEQNEIGNAGGDSEVEAIKTGTIFYGRAHGINEVTLPLRDRNGENIAALRVRSNSFFGETQNNAFTRSDVARKMIEQLITSADDLAK
jgi:hypothetical protein